MNKIFFFIKIGFSSGGTLKLAAQGGSCSATLVYSSTANRPVEEFTVKTSSDKKE